MAKEKETPQTVEVTLPNGMTAEELDDLLKSHGSKPDDSEVVFKEIESGHDQILRVYRNVFKGHEKLHLRRFYRKTEGEEWKPGKGATFDYEDIDEIIEGLEKAKEWCEEHPGKKD